MTLPTKKQRDSGTPSAARFSMPAGSETNSRSLIASVSLRLISSGMSSSRERRPGLDVDHDRPAPLDDLPVEPRAERLVEEELGRSTSAQPMVELTSPTTSTACGLLALRAPARSAS